ncbi:hypothetical protein N8I84_42125 (plasmid) [Streptomyces cynarae]|uniref:Uncharacterized protein n=1 Tax=Streptomyces cynarae TaxID=2981134 RepID=A0ABY6EE98_9ACTN|nr:hypothetical protein [Streptomyces cynarae]UXY25027.1 hypothetical protein N8I84_42125 [Streptomyces cynarae]
MTGPSSTPRGEHSPRPGANWETQLILYGEILVDTSGDTPTFLPRELPTTSPVDQNEPAARPARTGPPAARPHAQHGGKSDRLPRRQDWRAARWVQADDGGRYVAGRPP